MNLKIIPRLNTTKCQQEKRNHPSFSANLVIKSNFHINKANISAQDGVKTLTDAAAKYCGESDYFRLFEEFGSKIEEGLVSKIGYLPCGKTKGMKMTSSPILGENGTDSVIKFMQDQHNEYLKYNK